jgi:hypothetical protein
MDSTRIINTNNRQFENALRKQGIFITDFFKNTNIKVLFQRTKNERTSEDKEIIFFPSDSVIKKGDVIYYNSNYFVVLNVNYCENSNWKNSTLIKCNTVWSLYGAKVPMVASELSSVTPTNGNYLTTVNGVVSFYTKDIEILHSKIGQDDIFWDFGGAYKLVNKFFVDGLAYLYFQRTESPTASTLAMNYTGNTSYSLDATSVPLTFFVGTVGTTSSNIVPLAKIDYAVDNADVATIDADGILTLKSVGTVNVTATSAGNIETGSKVSDSDKYNVTKTIAINVTAPTTATLTVSSTSTDIQLGGSKKKLTLSERDKDGNAIALTAQSTVSCHYIDEGITSDATADVTITWTDGVFDSFKIVVAKTTITSAHLGGGVLRVDVTSPDGVEGYIDLTIISL